MTALSDGLLSIMPTPKKEKDPALQDHPRWPVRHIYIKTFKIFMDTPTDDYILTRVSGCLIKPSVR